MNFQIASVTTALLAVSRVTSAGYSGTGGATARVVGSISSIASATSVIVAFTPNYTSSSTSGYQIDKYDPNTFYIIT